MIDTTSERTALRQQFEFIEELRLQLQERDTLIEELRQTAAAELAARSEFFAGASHDVRQRVHAMKLLAQRNIVDRAEGPLDRPKLLQLAELLEELERCLGHILEFARLEGPFLQPKRHAFDLQSLFQRIEVQYEAVAIKRKVALRVRTTSHRLFSDPTMLVRIIENFVSNAIKFTRGQVLLSARRRGDKLFIEVRDLGTGIPAELVDRVFIAFYQVPLESGARREGAGLGLAIVKRLADALGYRVELSSRPTGTIARVIVPAQDLADP